MYRQLFSVVVWAVIFLGGYMYAYILVACRDGGRCWKGIGLNRGVERLARRRGHAEDYLPWFYRITKLYFLYLLCSWTICGAFLLYQRRRGAHSTRAFHVEWVSVWLLLVYLYSFAKVKTSCKWKKRSKSNSSSAGSVIFLFLFAAVKGSCGKKLWCRGCVAWYSFSFFWLVYLLNDKKHANGKTDWPACIL